MNGKGPIKAGSVPAEIIAGTRRELGAGEFEVTLPALSERDNIGLILERSVSHDGVFVGAVSPGSAAFNAGLQAGDRLLSFDGETVKDDVVFTFAEQRVSLPGSTVVAISRDPRHKGSISTGASVIDVSRSNWM